MLIKSKRLMGLGSLLFVEIIMFSLCVLVYTGKFYVTWDQTKALGYGVILGLLVVVTSVVVYMVRQKLNESIKVGKITEGILNNCQQFGLFHRKVIVWTYHYTVGEDTYKKKYWHLSHIRTVKIGDSFQLLLDAKQPKKTYFFYEQTQERPTDESL